MENIFSLADWEAKLLKYCRPKSRLDTERFFDAVLEGEKNLNLYPLEIGRRFFSVFSSYQDHGIYQRVYSAIQGLGVGDYYASLLENLERLIKEDAGNFWRTHLFTYAARPLMLEDLDEITETVMRYPQELREAFIRELKLSEEPYALKIISRLSNLKEKS
jgi:hypothetical protein